MQKFNFIFFITFSISLLFNVSTYSQEEKEIDTLFQQAKEIKFINPKKSVQIYTQYYQSALEEKDTLRAIKGLIEIGTIYSHNVNYSKAYDHLWKALLLADRHQKKIHKGRVYQELGWLYGFFNRKEEALKHFNASLEISRDLYKKNLVPSIYIFSDHFGLANFYRVNKNYDMYLKHLDSCVKIKNNIQGLHKNYYLEAELAYKLMLEKKYDKAIEKLQTAKDFFKEESITYLVVIEHILGKVYKAKGDYKKSIEAYTNSLQISNQYHCHSDYKIMSCDDLVEVYKIKNNYQKAFVYLKESKEMNEKIFGSKTENNQELLLLKDTFRTTKEEQQKLESNRKIELLKQEKYISFLKVVTTTTVTISVLIFVYFFIFYTKRKHQNEKKIIEEKQKLELEKKNEILELKNKELTTSALQLIEKEEFLKNLQQRLNKQDESINTKTVSKMINTIQGNPNSNWKEFETRFTLINQNFYKKLREQFPNLSQTDLKICALIKLNFTSKEMSSLLGISVESVHTSRYRLRKKLNLEKEQSLSDFINSI
ncbi:tetratricopeptide (TPR) repeat protein/DNA-binding CsgD family transcriptional regulator [Wenyingzhuangia heitensis]|uniref:Tetratricopeptide (TPR) repeat protein/DNA-binding CsgD family transcriptional regulator n=1 Tax=Wenyingzhuangia heitensis TaxID=1487859 RepID=A0ABX0UAX8_9FLAO|nr:hypothetical protein [Wenyingzhuangia heitensis]NIJ45878.1 tetratricopeptide (TPR) repeat protein/DNA-binding CsgD family transcriptional regulator [Wenyingzhuangia heitensis]